jgi:uncharacterized protein
MEKHQLVGVAWKSVLLFYALACAWSWPFLWWRDMQPDSWRNLALPGVLKTALYMWGPGLAGLVCWRLRPPPGGRRFSYLGRPGWVGAAFFGVPALILVVCHAVPGPGARGALLPAVLLGASFLTVLGEELGWRGYLQQVLHPLPPLRRYLLMGVMWEIWHFTNRTAHRPLLGAIISTLIFIGVLFLLSVVIGEAVQATSSLLVAQTLHSWFDLPMELGGPRTLLALALCFPLWLWLIWHAARQANRPWALRIGARGR